MNKQSQYGEATQPQQPQPQPQPQQQNEQSKRKAPGSGLWGGVQDAWRAFGEGVKTGLTADEYYDYFLSQEQWMEKYNGSDEDWRRWRKQIQDKMQNTGGPLSWLFQSLGLGGGRAGLR